MNKQPRWVPNWVWREYIDAKERDHALRFRYLDERLGDGIVHYANPERHLKIMEQLIASKECESVWRALERRKRDVLQSYSQVLEDGGLVKKEGFDPVEAYYIGFDRLADTICFALDGPQGTAQLTGAKRKSAAKKISSLADSLKKVLEETFLDDGHYLPYALLRLLTDTETIRLTINETPSENPPPREPSILEGLMTFPETLTLISKAAIIWGDEKPVLARPQNRNANRLFFIRVITNWFVQGYDSPLREQTLAITSLFFDCDDLDPSVIAKLAPCSNAN